MGNMQLVVETLCPESSYIIDCQALVSNSPKHKPRGLGLRL